MVLLLYMHKNLYIEQDKTVHTSIQFCPYPYPKSYLPRPKLVLTPVQNVFTRGQAGVSKII